MKEAEKICQIGSAMDRISGSIKEIKSQIKYIKLCIKAKLKY